MRATLRHLLMVGGLATLFIIPSIGLAQDPLGGVNYLVTWLEKLDSQFDSLVISEKKAQFQRSVDHLRKSLYELEADSRDLLNGIPDQKPTGPSRDHLLALERRLNKTVESLTEDVRAIGADLRLNDAMEVQMKFGQGLRARVLALTYLEEQLDSDSVWDSERIRRHLTEGISAVFDAQIAATALSKKLAASSGQTATEFH